MKLKHVALLACLLFVPWLYSCSPEADAWMSPVMIGGGVEAVASCVSPSCPATCEMSGTEGFEGGSNPCGTGDSECINTWASTTGSPVLASSPGSPSEGTGCSQSVRFDCDAGAESDIYWDHGSTLSRSNDIDWIVYIYIDSASVTNYQSNYLANWTGSTANLSGNYAGNLALRYDGANYKIWVLATTNTALLPISLQTWYKIKIHYDGATAADSYISINDGSTHETDYDTFTRYDVADGRYLAVGGIDIYGTDSIDMYVGYASLTSP